MASQQEVQRAIGILRVPQGTYGNPNTRQHGESLNEIDALRSALEHPCCGQCAYLTIRIYKKMDITKLGCVAGRVILQKICGMTGRHPMRRLPVQTAPIRRDGAEREEIFSTRRVEVILTILPRPRYGYLLTLPECRTHNAHPFKWGPDWRGPLGGSGGIWSGSGRYREIMLLLASTPKVMHSAVFGKVQTRFPWFGTVRHKRTSKSAAPETGK